MRKRERKMSELQADKCCKCAAIEKKATKENSLISNLTEQQADMAYWSVQSNLYLHNTMYLAVYEPPPRIIKTRIDGSALQHSSLKSVIWILNTITYNFPLSKLNVWRKSWGLWLLLLKQGLKVLELWRWTKFDEQLNSGANGSFLQLKTVAKLAILNGTRFRESTSFNYHQTCSTVYTSVSKSSFHIGSWSRMQQPDCWLVHGSMNTSQRAALPWFPFKYSTLWNRLFWKPGIV